MKTSRLKNIIIVILALANACLLVLLVSRRVQERSVRGRAVTELVRLYAAHGVELPESLVPTRDVQPASVDPSRDLDAEAAFAAAILGSCKKEEVGGGIYRYAGAAGQCLLRSSGVVEATLDRPVGDAEAFFESLFGDYGYAALSSDINAGSGKVVAARRLPSGAFVFNAELTLTFSRNHLIAVAGSFVPAAEPEVREDGVDGITALVRFLDYSTASGEVCTSVTDVRSGYLLQSTASVSQHLIPAWCVTTDVNSYYVNMLTGEVTREA